MKLRIRLVLLALTVSFCAVATNIVARAPKPGMTVVGIYVSPTGSDDQFGSVDEPVATLARAQELVREALKKDVAPGGTQVSVFVRPGMYFLDKPLSFTPADLPRGHEVSWHGEQGAVISGGSKLGPWRVDGKLWKIDIPAAKNGAWVFRDLYINNERRPRARTPNGDYFRVEKAGADRRTSFAFKPGDLKAIAEPSAAEIVFLHDWSISRIPIKATDEATSTIRFTHPIGNAAPHYAIDHFEPHPRYYLEGAPEFLDAPGEWHLDAKAGMLSYFPRAGETPETCEAIAPRLETLITIDQVKETGFHNLSFAHTHWPLPPGGYAGSQASFHEDRTDGKRPPGRKMVPAALLVDNATVLFRGCTFEHLGGSGLYLQHNCAACSVADCTFRDIGANGVMVGETGSRVSGVSTGNEVLRSTIEHCGQLDFGAVGIWVGIAKNTLVEGNTVRELPYTGVSVGWKWDPSPTACEGNIVRGNHIHHVLQKMSDGGGIYTLGRQEGTKLVNNKIHDIPVNLGRAESNGIFMDEGSSEILVEGNTIYNLARSPIRFHKALNNRLVKNTLVAAPGVPHFRYNNASEKTMTFDGNQLLTAEKWTPPGGE